jgi:hypothetical protein
MGAETQVRHRCPQQWHLEQNLNPFASFCGSGVARTELRDEPEKAGEMTEDILIAFERLRNLGTPRELQEAADRADSPSSVGKANAHVHLPPNFSAFQSIDQAVVLAMEQGIRVLGVSNYYDFGIYSDFAAQAWQRGVYPLFGLEIIALLEDLQRASILINDPGNPGRMYICGKGIVRFAPMSPAATDLTRWIRQNDAERMRRMVELVEQIFARHGVQTGLDEFRILDRITQRFKVDRSAVCLQERHIAEAFEEAFVRIVPPNQRVERLSTVLGIPSQAGPEDYLKMQHEIRSFLMKVGKPAFVAERFVDFDQAYRLVLELGGIPCYPTLADGASPICAYEDPPEQLVEALKLSRIFCAEFIPIRNKPEVLDHYVRTLRSAGIVVTGGTEHNTPVLLPLEPRCARGLPVPDKIQEIFWEGACVVVAHQFLSLHGKCGYVDANGSLNPDFSNIEDRISCFARLGAAVLARYHEVPAGKGVICHNG